MSLPAGSSLDPVRARSRPVRDHLGQLVVDEMRAHAVVAGQPGSQRAIGDELVVQRPPAVLGVVVRAEAPRQQPQPVGEGPQRPPERVGGSSLEPADPARAGARQHDARVPGLAHDHVQLVHPPDGEHVGHAATPHEDHVLGEQQVGRIGHIRHREQRQVADPSRLSREPVIHFKYPPRVVAHGRIDHADPRLPLPAQPQRVAEVERHGALWHHHAAADRDHMFPLVSCHAVTVAA